MVIYYSKLQSSVSKIRSLLGGASANSDGIVLILHFDFFLSPLLTYPSQVCSGCALRWGFPLQVPHHRCHRTPLWWTQSFFNNDFWLFLYLKDNNFYGNFFPTLLVARGYPLLRPIHNIGKQTFSVLTKDYLSKFLMTFKIHSPQCWRYSAKYAWYVSK